jgi:hypothetical protein
VIPEEPRTVRNAVFRRDRPGLRQHAGHLLELFDGEHEKVQQAADLSLCLRVGPLVQVLFSHQEDACALMTEQLGVP